MALNATPSEVAEIADKQEGPFCGAPALNSEESVDEELEFDSTRKEEVSSDVDAGTMFAVSGQPVTITTTGETEVDGAGYWFDFLQQRQQVVDKAGHFFFGEGDRKRQVALWERRNDSCAPSLKSLVVDQEQILDLFKTLRNLKNTEFLPDDVRKQVVDVLRLVGGNYELLNEFKAFKTDSGLRFFVVDERRCYFGFDVTFFKDQDNLIVSKNVFGNVMRRIQEFFGSKTTSFTIQIATKFFDVYNSAGCRLCDCLIRQLSFDVMVQPKNDERKSCRGEQRKMLSNGHSEGPVDWTLGLHM